MLVRTAALLTFALTLGGCDRVPGTAEYRDVQSKIADASLIDRAKERATHDLHDPFSAEFRELKVRRQKPHDQVPATSVCGEVNGKNLNGAYVGFTPFVWSQQTNSALLRPQDDVSQDDVDDATRLCRGGVATSCTEALHKLHQMEEAATFDAYAHSVCG